MPRKASWLNPGLFLCTRKSHLAADIQQFWGMELVAYTTMQTSDHMEGACLHLRDFLMGAERRIEKGWCRPTDVLLRIPTNL